MRYVPLSFGHDTQMLKASCTGWQGSESNAARERYADRGLSGNSVKSD